MKTLQPTKQNDITKKKISTKYQGINTQLMKIKAKKYTCRL